MVRIFISIFLLISVNASGQTAEIVKLNRITQLLESKTHKIQIVNFWATWCAPCIKELPVFEKLNSQSLPGINITLVSLDLDLDSDPAKVYKFINRKNLKTPVVLLDEQDANLWIDKISPSWSGAIPATLVVNTENGKRKFVEGELKEGDLEKMITELK